MKQLTYNQSNALSILLASFFFGKYPEAKVKTSESDGTNFLAKLEDEKIKPMGMVKILTDEQGGELAKNLSAGIVAQFHDVSNFEGQMKLKKALDGDANEFNKIVEVGKAVNAYKASPAFKVDAEREFLTEEVDVDTEEVPDEEPPVQTDPEGDVNS